MTTITQTRIPLETLSMSQPTARRRSKRIAAYEEEDDGFTFTRGSKRTKTAPSAPESAPGTASAPGAKTGRARKREDERQRDDCEVKADTMATQKPSRRTMNFATPKAPADRIVVSKRRRSTRSSAEKGNGDSSPQHPSGTESQDFESINMVGGDRTSVEESNISISDVSKPGQPTVISLPFSDTPIINRNKELRKKGAGSVRRSSLGLRGRRASSLIDNGHSAIPHREVETKEFYKHIESEGLSEPRRMKQLLTWTGERALSEKPLHGDVDAAAKHAARMIEESLMRGFANKSEFSDWFNREESVPTKIIKKPNPRNVDLEDNLAGLETRIKSLKEERDQWKTLSRPPEISPFLPKGTTEIQPSYIDTSLLDPEQSSILTSILNPSAHSIRNNATERLRSLQEGIEFKVDHFADGVHKLEQFQKTVSRVADKILALSAVRLEERERKEKQAVGTRDVPMQEVLRSLSRILPESGGQR